MDTLRFAGSVAFIPFSEYQPSKPFSRRWIGFTILTCSILTLIGLALFNIHTQGHDLITSTIVSQIFYSKQSPLRNGTSETTCQSSLLDVSSSYYTRTPTSVTNSTALVNPGSFKWTVNAFNPNGKLDTVQAAYNGEEMSCNVSSFGLTYHFAGNYFMFGICAKCRMLEQKDETYGGTAHIEMLDVCSHYNQQFDDWPSFAAEAVISQISERATNVGTFYNRLNFKPGTLPEAVFPWGSTVHSADITITPSLIEYVNIWLGGFSYYNTSATFSLTDGNNGDCGRSYCPQGAYRTVDPKDGSMGDEEYTDMAQLLRVAKTSSGSVLPVLGVGNLQPSLANDGDISQLPGVLPEMYNGILSIAGYMVDAALLDLTGRSIATSFICTVQTKKQKEGWVLIAVVLGSTLAVFGAIRTVFIILGAFVDEQLTARDGSQVTTANVVNLNAPVAISLEPQSPMSPYHDSQYAKATFV